MFLVQIYQEVVQCFGQDWLFWFEVGDGNVWCWYEIEWDWICFWSGGYCCWVVEVDVVEVD